MWNVSGVTGAAPIWTEMMNYLHQDVRQRQPAPPPGLVKRRVHCTPAPAGEEWFMVGTEPRQEGQRIGQRNERILYPPAGTLIALDPDIPRRLQKVFFVAATNSPERCWVLNGVRISARGKAIAWTPKRGDFVLCLTDEQARVLDQVGFKVRGEACVDAFPSAGGTAAVTPPGVACSVPETERGRDHIFIDKIADFH
jgi:penicillin-binding protein 1C